MLKNFLLYWIRKLGGVRGWDRFYFYFNKIRFHSRNKRFKQEHPQFSLPPDYLLYESYRLDYQAYFSDGRDAATWVMEQLSTYGAVDKILEWGCGPARVVRHLPVLLPESCIHGCDYNQDTIQWCRKNISKVHFSLNDLKPPLPYDAAYFNAVYALSVLTHLSEENHFSWINELNRIIKPGGILLVTTQGKAFLSKLTTEEKILFSQGSLVQRAGTKEGHRSFSAFQPGSFMYSLFSNSWKVLKFQQGEIQNWGPEQDTWIVQKIN